MSKKVEKILRLEEKEKAIKGKIRQLRADVAKSLNREDSRLKYLLGGMIVSQLSVKSEEELLGLVIEAKSYFKRVKDRAFVLGKLQVFLRGEGSSNTAVNVSENTDAGQRELEFKDEEADGRNVPGKMRQFS